MVAWYSLAGAARLVLGKADDLRGPLGPVDVLRCGPSDVLRGSAMGPSDVLRCDAMGPSEALRCSPVGAHEVLRSPADDGDIDMMANCLGVQASGWVVVMLPGVND